MPRALRYLVAFLFVLGLIAILLYGFRRQSVLDRLLQPGPEGAAEVAVTLFFADAFGECLVAETRRLPAGDDLPLRVLQALAEGPASPDLVGTIPAGARVLSVTVQDGLAIVDYSRELRDNHPGGSAGEMLTAYAIVGSLVALKGIDAVQILLEGEVVETLVGHLIFSEPMTVPEEALQAGRICL